MTKYTIEVLSSYQAYFYNEGTDYIVSINRMISYIEGFSTDPIEHSLTIL